MFADPGDPHFTGPITVEFGPDGIRWWWLGRDDDEPDGHVTPEMLVQYAFLECQDDIKEALQGARAYLEQAAKEIDAMRKTTSWRVIS